MAMKARSPPPPAPPRLSRCSSSLRSSVCTSISDLPHTIFINIILRVPLKSVLTCKCVAKTWLGMLSDPWFANEYINRSPSDYFMYTREKQLEDNRVVVFGSCNGLLLCGYESSPVLYVENPFVRDDLITLPPDEDDNNKEDTVPHPNYSFGIGYSLISAKYKVVKITQVSTTVTEAKICVLGGVNSTNSWRSIENPPPPCGEWWNHGGVFIRGALYWFITVNAGNGYMSGSICCLDMETEKFHFLPPPPPLVRFNDSVFMWLTAHGVWYFRESGLRICKYGDCISVSFCHFGYGGRVWNMWIMKEYGVKESWTEDFVFQNNKPYEIYPVAIVVSNVSKIFLTSLNHGGLFTYCRGSKSLEKLIDYDEGVVEHIFIPSSLSLKDL